MCDRPGRVLGLAALLIVLSASMAHAQYFGRNKVQYRTFQFEILKTEHFDIYHYPEEGKAAELAARMPSAGTRACPASSSMTFAGASPSSCMPRPRTSGRPMPSAGSL